ncbi:hypothetical protein GCQ56_08145 [Marinifilum sp. N1E240]|uniref:WD40/YVTN/BNR-like repeat-containing protein n=1 Tax=Marinifilum sp. N1E240 TaxID=2608082 RepID=UPI00128B18C4|nr:hypothetical protein [Marinifilum sp. N1E240]MPQ46985.1 hypothetical protein [Marinifilum sp. N1E240]
MILNSACEDIFGSDDSSHATIEVVAGDKQNGHLGSTLNIPIKIKGHAKNSNGRLMLKCKTFQGNGGLNDGIGDIYESSLKKLLTDGETVSFTWRLGCDQENQKIKIYVHERRSDEKGFYDNGSGYNEQASDSLIIESNGTLKKGWNRSAGYYRLDPSRIKIRSFDGQTLFMINNYLYRSDDGGLNWEKVEGVPHNGYLFDAQFNSQGTLYVLTSDNGVCYTNDFENWEFINNGFVKDNNPTCFLVRDEVMYVSFYGEGIYKTVNQGKFWEKLHVKNNPGSINHIACHPNGDIYLVEDYQGLWVSKDQGALWKLIYLNSYVNYKIEDFKIDDKGFLYFGSHGASISKLSPENYEGEIHIYFYNNTRNNQFVNNITIENGEVYYLVNNMHYPGIYSIANNWQLIDINFKGQIDFFYRKADGNFLVLKENGLYYYNE